MPIYMVTAMQRWLTQEVRNVFYYDFSGELDGQQMQEVADNFADAWTESGILPALDNAWEMYGVEIRRVDVADLPAAFVQFTEGVVLGSSSAVPTGTQVAALVSGRASTQKPRRVRTYFAGSGSNQIGQDGLWVGSHLSDLGLLADALDSMLVAGDTGGRVAVEWTGTPPRVTSFNRIQAYLASPVPATQRRRRLTVGI